jgi:hypothetical protein
MCCPAIPQTRALRRASLCRGPPIIARQRGLILRPRSFAKHFRHDKNEHGSTQSASAKEINQGITGGSKHRRDQKCEHKCEWVIVKLFRLAFPGAETARDKEDQADEQNQANSAAADDRSAQVKPAATEQQEQNHHE